MRLTYFISPYDLINISNAELEPINIDSITSKNLGYSVTVCMEGSAAHKLQTTTLITVNRSMNCKSTPSFSPLGSQNSAIIPATFVLKLNKPLPMCVNLVMQLQAITELEWVDFTTKRPLLDLIVCQSSEGKLRSENNRGLFLNLPDQNHCYFMTDNKNVEGILVNSIPFTHPAKVAQILVLLRQQALFNTVISSCVRPNSRQNFDNLFMLEISALSWTHISISLEHPSEESMATADIDLTEISRLSCKIHTPGTPPPPNAPDAASELATRVLNKSFSIPITIRSIIKFWERQQSLVRRNHFGIGNNGHENFSLPLDSCDPGGGSGPKGGGGGSGGGSLPPEFEGLDGGGTRVKQELCQVQSGNSVMQRDMFLNETIMSNPNFQNFPSSERVLELLGNPGNEKISKRTHKKSRTGEDTWRSKNRKAGDEDILLENSNSSDSASGSTSLSQQDAADINACNSASLGFQSDLELSTMDPTELTGLGKTSLDSDNNDDSQEAPIERMCRTGAKSPGDVLAELDDKNLVPSNVSITPIGAAASAPNFGQERRPSFDQSSLTTSSSTLLPSSITITPIPQSKSSSEEKYKERKSSKSRSDEKSRMERKRKKKRDESPMGPPEKIPPKQDPLSKPISVSIKPSESSPPPTLSTPSSPGILKYSASPTHRSLSGKLSPSLAKQNLKGHHSPKHSPAHIPSSPKHTIGLSSPKNHGASPKHLSTSGSGKPSMSTLKNATNSPNSKSDSSKTKSSSKESSRDKDKKQSSTFPSVGSKNKSSSKNKLSDSSSIDLTTSSQLEGQVSPGLNTDANSNSNQARRKGTLSAIVDKLKSAQHCDLTADSTSSAKLNNRLDRDRSSGGGGQFSKSSDSKTGTTKSSSGGADTKNSEYMVKPSSDGIKLTINKTRAKDTARSKVGSPKVHTGLKPGVNSGPASKKPQQQQQQLLQNQKSSSISSSATVNSSRNSPKHSTSSVKSSSSPVPSSNKSSKASSSSQNKDRPKLSKSSSDKSVFSSKERGKASPTPREDQDKYYNSSLKMEGLVKQLDKNFQIPKLSARVGAPLDDKKSSTKDGGNSVNRSPSDSKIYDMMSKGESKYPHGMPNNKILESMEAKFRNNLNSISPAPPMLNRKEPTEDEHVRRDQHVMASYPIPNAMSNKSYGAGFGASDQPLSLSMKTAMELPKFVTPDTPRDKREAKKVVGGDCDMLLDYSKGGPEGTKATPYPASPSVSVHIVKSPAPHPSPISPRLADDELTDEGLVGLGK
ncbi:hypothetical protein WA026_000519 [Henosepilachna vigintioctopunctata]|uniref:Mediator of RNA polymerase II transcription subunit 1 n=1 Tax=Henosepilachna vigintioctopunctata TaxID=420089 RepID=A0AAW1V8L3_9CUCU